LLLRKNCTGISADTSGSCRLARAVGKHFDSRNMIVGNEVNASWRCIGEHIGHHNVFGGDEGEIRVRDAQIFAVSEMEPKRLKRTMVDQFADFLFRHAHT
jgi:hypothetical protein